MTPKNVFKLIEEHELRFVDFRFCDLKGQSHHITMPIRHLEEDTFTEGFNFDGSSVEGWCEIHNSDMTYRPDPATAHVDPFMAHPTLVLTCDVVDPTNNQPYNRDPRTIAKRAEEYLKETGIADTAFFGPELEFFVFDNVLYGSEINESFYHVDASSGSWNSGRELEEGNTGHLATTKGGYFKMPPVDRLHDMRSEMLEVMEQMGYGTRLHHAEVGTASQCEVGTDADTLVKKGDESQSVKHVVRSIAEIYGKTATFMPKPLAGDNGSGMHVHQSLWKDGKNIFAGDVYAGLSQEALYYIGGIIKHAKALNAFTNPLTNSYKRLVPGYEAPVILTYANRNRSAAIRIPSASSDKARRIETRFPDAGANPYLAFSALMLAGLDGIKNKIDPGKAREENLYTLPAGQNDLPEVCGSLEEALQALDADRAFLTAGGVFDDDMIDGYIALKHEDVIRLNHTPHPVEFGMYYSI